MWNRKLIAITVAGLLIGISGMALQDEVKRKPSSATTAKWTPAPLGKHLAPVKVEIQKIESIPTSGNEEVQLVGRLFINQDISSDLSFTWTLPEEVQVVEGQLSDSLPNVQAGQIVEVRLTVTGFNSEKQRMISLQAWAQKGDSRIGNSAITVSRPQDTWEAVAAEMQESADEQLGRKSQRPRR
jgi:hypothetical protein